MQYPHELKKYEYDPNFAIRGLHYDVHKVSIWTYSDNEGLLSRGTRPIWSDGQILRLYLLLKVLINTMKVNLW